jgi:signal transduction histidine kinase
VPLIDAFNLALERLEQGYRTQQQFLAAAAHELKTPLALMRGQVELEGTADRPTLLADIDVMARQVQQLLNLAEVSEAGNYQFESIDVVDVAMQTVSFMSRMADRKLVHLDLKVPADELRWQGDKSALFTLLKNLLENAIQHSPAGGIVTVSLEVGGLTVHNEGAGIAADHMPLVFERFWRAHGQDDSQHRGVGLGLSICWEIALAHGWQLRVCDVPSGAMFRLDAPSVAESI